MTTFTELMEIGRAQVIAEREATEAARLEAERKKGEILAQQVKFATKFLVMAGLPDDVASEAVSDSGYAREGGAWQYVSVRIPGFAPISLYMCIWEAQDGNSWNGKLDSLTVNGHPYITHWGDPDPIPHVEWSKSDKHEGGRFAYALAIAEERGQVFQALVEEIETKAIGDEAAAESNG